MITALTDPAQLPNQLDDQETFDTKMANFLDNLPTRAQQENELAANMGMYAAGGAYAFPYVFDSSTADADPGVGKLRLSSATQNAASIVMRMDLQAVGGADMTNVLADLRSVTSTVKGSVRLVKQSDPSKWLIFDVTAVALPTGYRNLSMTWRATGGGLASPFVNGDALMVFIDRNGDAGTVPGSTELLAEVNISSPVAAISFPSVFGQNHDWFIVDIEHFTLASENGLLVNFIGGGSVLTGNYTEIASGTSSNSNNSQWFQITSQSSTQVSALMHLRNVKSNRKSIIVDGLGFGVGSTPFSGIARRGQHGQATPADGFQLSGGAVMINSALVRVYGVRKA